MGKSAKTDPLLSAVLLTKVVCSWLEQLKSAVKKAQKLKMNKNNVDFLTFYRANEAVIVERLSACIWLNHSVGDTSMKTSMSSLHGSLEKENACCQMKVQDGGRSSPYQFSAPP